MKMTLDELLHEYETCHHKYENCKQSTERLIQTILDKAGVRVHKVECRVKHRESLRRKIELKRDKYEQLSQITDLVAFRIITFFEDEVDKVAEIIRSEFDIDENNSVDKRLQNSEKFGYQSLHYVFTYKKGRTDFLEYEQFKELKCEIQIRSILQHAWAEIEHDIGYKSEAGIPLPAKRNFMRVAALLETADLEFKRLRDTLIKYNIEISDKVISNPQDVLLDKNSLMLFANQNETVERITNRIASHFNLEISEYEGVADELIRKLSYVDIKNIENLKQLIEINSNRLEEFAMKFIELQINQTSAISITLPIFILIMLLLVDNGKIHLILDADLTEDGIDTHTEEYKNNILESYEFAQKK